MSKEINSTRLDQIARHIAEKIPSLVAEAEKQLLADYAYAVNEAHEQAKDKSPNLKMTFAVEFNPGSNVLGTSMTWSVKRTIEDSDQLPGPDQPELPGVEDMSVTIRVK